MYTITEIGDRIAEICRETLEMPSLDDHDDFFDRGANSLTIVQLQLNVEKQVDLKVSTSHLMLNSSIDGWRRAYQGAMASANNAIASQPTA